MDHVDPFVFQFSIFVMAVFVGYRSVAPDEPLPFSARHYNFAVTVEGAFRRAVELQAALEATAAMK